MILSPFRPGLHNRCKEPTYACLFVHIQARQEGSEGSQLAAAAAKAVKDQAMSLGAWDNLTVVAVVLDWEGK